MKSFQYQKNRGWSCTNFPDLDSPNTLILAFAAPCFKTQPEILRDLAKHYPQSKMIGCSTAGEILANSIYDESISVVVARFDKTQLEITEAEVTSPDHSFDSGCEIRKTLNKPGLRSIFVLSDGLLVNGSELVDGLNQGIDSEVSIAGGLAGDGSDFKNTWTLINGEIRLSHVVAIGFYGDSLVVGHESRGGWDIFGPLRHITRSEGNILYELDDKPALQLYKEYLGDKATELPASGLLYPLAISDPSQEKTVQLVRTILAVDEPTQSLIFAGNIPLGWNAQLMRANFDRLINSANDAGDVALERHSKGQNLGEKPLLVIAISCVGRRLLLGERTEEETEAVLDAMPPGATQVGFYSYGELSPYGLGACELHNQTMTLTLYSEL